MRKKRTGHDASASVRAQFKTLIGAQYRSLENFAYSHDLNKSTLQRMMTGERNDHMVGTLSDVAAALGYRLVLKLERKK